MFCVEVLDVVLGFLVCVRVRVVGCVNAIENCTVRRKKKYVTGGNAYYD